MFGRKSREIKELRGDLEYIQLKRDEYWERYADTDDKLARKESELKILQEAFRAGVKITEELKEQIADLETRNDSLKYELAEAHLLNETIKEEVTESSRMLELYKALLAQIQVVVKLPARKK